jgi:predicted transporter
MTPLREPIATAKPFPGGTAGISLAARLTENPAFNVLVIEAGPAPDSINQIEKIPGLYFILGGMLHVHPPICHSHLSSF